MPADLAALPELLSRILSTRGVRYAAYIGADGQLLGSAGDTPPDAKFMQSAKAVAQSLVATSGGQALKDLLMDFEDGPVLLTPQQDQWLVVGFDEVGNLGRVRFAVKREMSKL